MKNNLKFISELIKFRLSHIMTFRLGFFAPFFINTSYFLVQLFAFEAIYGHAVIFSCLRSLPITCHKVFLVCGSNPVVGSSKISIFGLCSKARATSILRRCPPESFPTGRFSRSSKAKRWESSANLVRKSLPLIP